MSTETKTKNKPVKNAGAQNDDVNIDKASEANKNDATEPAPEVEKKKPIIAKDIDPDQYVTVRNGFQGKLVYKSKRTGEKYIWDAFGDEQDMQLSELKNARNSYKTFFINNWFMFDEEWIVDYLGLNQYYRYAVRLEDFDKLFEGDIEDAVDAISKMSKGQKKSVAYRARDLIAQEVIDSTKMIKALEAVLGTALIER